jgi:quercetin dioxygenase-like cupin family protein
MLMNAPALSVLGKAEGPPFDIAGAHLVWKARTSDTGGAFCLFEQRIDPGEGVPLHRHGYSEVFYVLAGTLQFEDQQGGCHACTVGDTIIARPETAHSFRNDGPETVRMLSIAAAAHQGFFDAVAEADQEVPFATMPANEAMMRVFEIGAKTDTRFEPIPNG